MNIIFLTGNVGKDPEVKTTQNGVKVATFSLATTEHTKEPKTIWHNIVMFNKMADVAEQYIRKGVKIAIAGKQQNDRYEKDGTWHTTTQVIANDFEFLDKKSNSSGSTEPQTPTVEPTDNLPF